MKKVTLLIIGMLILSGIFFYMDYQINYPTQIENKQIKNNDALKEYTLKIPNRIESSNGNITMIVNNGSIQYVTIKKHN